jgi:hypothetical protein
MRMIQRFGLVTAAGCMLAVATANASPTPPDSGVRGMVLLGPTCPVQHPGHSCVQPYRALITIRREPGGKLIVRVRSASDGRFTASLPAGRYMLQPRNGTPFPRAQSQTMTVRPHRFTAVTIRFASGIE